MLLVRPESGRSDRRRQPAREAVRHDARSEMCPTCCTAAATGRCQREWPVRRRWELPGLRGHRQRPVLRCLPGRASQPSLSLRAAFGPFLCFALRHLPVISLSRCLFPGLAFIPLSPSLFSDPSLSSKHGQSKLTHFGSSQKETHRLRL